MRVIRVEALPEGSLEAAAEFHAKVLPKVMALLVPPPTGEGDHPQGGGGVRAALPDLAVRIGRGCPSTILRMVPLPVPGRN